jgi:hypothetical protein
MSVRPRSVLLGGWALAVVAVAVGVIWYVLMGGRSASAPDRAQVAGTLLAAVAVVPPAMWWAWGQLRRRAAGETSSAAQVEAAADLLAVRTFATWSYQLFQRGIQVPAPIRVRWRWAGDDIAPSRVELVETSQLSTDPQPLHMRESGHAANGQVLNSGLVTRLHNEVYARLAHGRLVVVGNPGEGKTGAMMLLLVEALRHRNEAPSAQRAAVPVPVWLTLGSWDPTSQNLRAWVTATMARDHPYLRATDFGPDAIGGLFDTSRIALFLDGLDEMPETFRRKAIERLTTETAGLRLTLTSRPDQLRATIQTGRQLPNTAVVELDPVDPRAAARYLLQDQIEPARSAWQQVADHLRAEPESVLARTLRTPLTLSLARMLYSGGDPTQLLRHGLESEQKLRGHLLDQVLVTAYPNPQQRAHVNYWLGWLSHRMNTQPNGAIRDLCWWQVPSWITRAQFRLAAVVTVGLASGLIWLPLGRSRALTALVILGVVGLYFGRQASSVAPQSMTIRWPTRQALRVAAATVLAYMVIIGVLAALIAGGISRVEASTRGGARRS